MAFQPEAAQVDDFAAFDHPGMLPGAAVLYYSLGKLHFNRRQLNASIAAHHAALALAPDFAYVHNDVGNALSDATGRQSEVLHHYSEAARLLPSFAEAFSNVGTILKDRGSVGEAARYFSRAIEIKPTLCEAYKNLGSCHTETGKLVAARDAFEGALRINPQFWPALYALLDSKQFLCDWRGRPALLAVLQDHLDALHGGKPGGLGAGPDERMHGGLSPFNTLVWPVSDRMRTLVTRHRARKDVEHAAASPLSPPLRWAGRAAAAATAAAAAEREGARAAVATTPGRPERLDGALAADALTAGGGGGGDGGGMLRLGFISSDFGDHPVGHAVLPWLRALQRGGRVAVYAFASDSAERRHSGSALRRDLAASTRFFCDLTALSDDEAARAVNEQRVHVLVNLVGHTAGARHSLTQRHVAPVQAMHYGYPGSTGLPAMHYVLLDAAAAPPSMRRQFSERLAYFPHSHFIAAHASRYPHVLGATARAHPWQGLHGHHHHAHQGHHATGVSGARGAVAVAGQAARAPEPLRRRVRASDGSDATRADIGLMLRDAELRDGSVALCNFNQLYKLDPLTMEAWANSLRRAPRAHLWLSRVTVRKDSSDIAEANVGAHAAALGVRHDRLAYAWKYPDHDYIPFRALADLMVDNRLYNAHTTGADTFWAGVPAVALAADHLAGRATASFARALGVGSMVVPGLRGYEDATIDLVTRAPRLWTLRRRLLHMRERAPFFDLPRLARAQEKLAHAMWEVFAAGVLPMHVAIAR